MDCSGVEITSVQLHSYIKRLNNHQKRIHIPHFIRWNCQFCLNYSVIQLGPSGHSDKIRLQINKRTVNGKNWNHSSISVFQDTFHGISSTFQYISQYEFRAEHPPIPVHNLSSEKQTHLCSRRCCTGPCSTDTATVTQQLSGFSLANITLLTIYW